MEAVFVGFAIALAIGLTGVGAGITTAPVLILIFGVPAAAAVGTALIFGANGIPGVVACAAVPADLDAARYRAFISAAVGCNIVVFALFSLYRLLRPPAEHTRRDRSWLLAALAFPSGAEVGFSSAGSGLLASLALMSYTRLAPAQIVGTDVYYGLAISLVGGGVLASGAESAVRSSHCNLQPAYPLCRFASTVQTYMLDSLVTITHIPSAG